MVRTNKSVSKPLAAAEKSKDQRRMSGAERSAYFARREAAKVLRSVLQGDARRRAVGSIKSLVYSPSVRNKKATFALVCQTLKYLPIIRDLLNASSTLNSKWKRQQELMYIITYDILFGKENLLVGDAEKFLMCRKDALESALARYLVKKKVKHIEELIALHHTPDDPKPRYVRVNTLKLDVDSALVELSKHFMNGIDWSKPLKLSLAAFDEGMFRHYLCNAVQKDGMVPHLLVLPPGSDVHDHPLVKNGSVILQGKASSMVAAALDPKPGWDVLDACSAPGNKTVHLAALMRGKGRIIACEMNKERVKRLEDTVRLSGATNIEVLCGDFLSLDPKDPSFCKVRAIIVDPSCSGSGTTAERLDHLLPSHAADHARGFAEIERLDKLAAFQRKALAHALSFPAVERVVYSTCSVHQTENEDVVSSILPLAVSNGFQLATPFPQWHRRGLPVFEGSEHLLRTDPVEDKEGFFIALFVKNKQSEELSEAQRGAPRHFEDNRIITSRIKNKSRFLPGLSTRLSNMWFPTHSCVRKRSNNCSNEE